MDLGLTTYVLGSQEAYKILAGMDHIWSNLLEGIFNTF